MSSSDVDEQSDSPSTAGAGGASDDPARRRQGSAPEAASPLGPHATTSAPAPAAAGAAGSASSPGPATAPASPAGLAFSCPHCQSRVRCDRPLERRASARCPGCNRKIWLDPFQQLFPRRICLTNEEATHVDYLMRLGDLRCGQPVVLRIGELRASLSTEALGIPRASDIMTAAFDLAAEQCVDPDEERVLRELRRSYRSFLRRGAVGDDHDGGSSGPSSHIGSLVDEVRRHVAAAAAKVRSFLFRARHFERGTSAPARTSFEATGRCAARVAELAPAFFAEPNVQALVASLWRSAACILDGAPMHVTGVVANGRLTYGLTVARRRVVVGTLL